MGRNFKLRPIYHPMLEAKTALTSLQIKAITVFVWLLARLVWAQKPSNLKLLGFYPPRVGGKNDTKSVTN